MIDIFNRLEKHKEGIEKSIKDYLYHCFIIGEILNEMEGDYIYNDMLGGIDIDEKVKDIGRNLNNHYNHNIGEFERQLYLVNDNLAKIEINGNKPTLSNDDSNSDVIHHLQNWLSTKDDLSRSFLIDTMNRISKIVNVSYNLDDMTYIHYSYCCGCGSLDIPEGGFTLKETEGIKYPLCNTCLANNIVDIKKVLNLYYVYAVNTEKGINKL